LKRQIQRVARWTPDRRSEALLKAFFLLSGPELGPRPRLCAPRPHPPERVKPRSNAWAAPHAVQDAVLCCCTLGPAVRIWLLTCGAKGTLTLAPCLQNRPRLSETVAYLGTRPWVHPLDRAASDPVVVRFGGQCSLRVSGDLLARDLDGTSRCARGDQGRQVQPLKSDALLVVQDPQALMRCRRLPPSATRNSASLDRLQVETAGHDRPGGILAIFLISRRCGKVNLGGRPPRYFGYSELNPSALKLRITSRTRSSLVNAS
jgi:hypothetical protein